MFNFSVRKVGGFTWVKLGRFTMAFAVAREFRPIGEASGQRKPKARRFTARQVAAIAKRERNYGAWLAKADMRKVWGW